MRDMNALETMKLAMSLLAGNRLSRKSPGWSPDQMREYQFDLIKKLVRHAYDNVPFYRELYSNVSFAPGDLKTWDDFHQLPIVTKNDVIDNYPAKIVQQGLCTDDLIVSRSSGSSGKVLDIAYDSKAFITYVIAGLRLYNMGFKYRPWHSQVYIYTSPYPMKSLFGLFPLHHISTLAPIADVIPALIKIQPDLLVCYPSHLKQIAQELVRTGRELRPRSISVNSEMSTQQERADLTALFQCPVLDEYSSEELTRIAAQCRCKTYHLFEDINYVEVLDPENQPTRDMGTLVGTNLHNMAMPMIRYQQNDLAIVRPSTCDCGWRYRELKDLQGRKNDSFVMPSGRVLTSGFLLDATYDFLLADRSAILDFCLIQKEVALIVLEIVPGPGWNQDVAAKINRQFDGFLEPEVSFAIERVEECTKTKTGKRNPIINLTTRK